MGPANWRARTGSLVLGAVTFAAGLLWLLPATLLDQQISKMTSGSVRLAAAEGTIWAGQGYVEILNEGKPIGYSRHVAWRFVPASVLRGHLTFALRINHSDRSIPVILGWSGVELRDVSIDLPAMTLEMAMPALRPLGLNGDLSLNITRVALNGDQSTGSGRLELRNAMSTMTTIAPLGNYVIELISERDITSVAMRTLEGPLQLSGRGSWPTGTAPVFRGSAHVPASLQQQLAPMLRLIAIEKGPGDFELQIQQTNRNPGLGGPVRP